MRRIGLCVVVAALCGCADDDDTEIPPESIFAGVYAGTCEETIDGVLMHGTIEARIDPRGGFAGEFTYFPGDATKLVTLTGHVTNTGQFTGEEQLPRMAAIPCEGTVTETNVGIDGDLTKTCGVPLEVRHLLFSMTRQ